MEPLKEMFNEAYYQKLVKMVASVYPALNKKSIYGQLTDGITGRSLNERLRHTAYILQQHLPARFEAAIGILDQVIPRMDRGYTALVFPEFVARFGLDHTEYSMEVLKRYTIYGSSEFAIREFLKKDFEKSLSIMLTWLDDPNPHVRRLVSEGSRPRLPWSFKLDAVVLDPGLTKPVLNALRADPELYVKKSVANHLNDIAKEHPEYMLGLVRQWDLNNVHTAWIVRHASRSLVKQGHQAALRLLNVKSRIDLAILKFRINSTRINLGQTLQFEFYLKSKSKKEQKLIVDYILHYRKKAGGLSPKVFKLKEIVLLAGSEVFISKSQRIIDFTTRKHYPGRHKLSIQVNGNVLKSVEFNLVV